MPLERQVIPQRSSNNTYFPKYNAAFVFLNQSELNKSELLHTAEK